MESFVKVWYLCAYKGLTYSLNLVCNVSQFKFKLIKLTMFWHQSVQSTTSNHFQICPPLQSIECQRKKMWRKRKTEQWALLCRKRSCGEAFLESSKLSFEFQATVRASCFCWSHLFSVVCTRARLALLAHLSEALLGFYIGSILGSMSFYIQPLPQNST